MSDEQFSPEEQALIEHLRQTQRPQINAEARATIHDVMIAEYRAVIASGQSYAPTYHLPFRVAPVLVAAAALVVVVLVITQITRPPFEKNETVTPHTSIAIVPSDSSQSTALPELATPTPALVLPSQTLVSPTVTGSIPTTSVPTAINIPLIPTTTQETIIIIEGPVSAINDNVLSIYDVAVKVPPGHPILNLLEVGDFVRIEGAYETDGLVAASIVGNLDAVTVVDGERATVNLDGPVESIEANQVMVNGIIVEIDPDDPILDTLQVGSFVSLQGNFTHSGAAIVLIVVKLTVINEAEAIQDDCWYHADAMGMGMGHWHCDGMGMGMGMGEPAMGMGGMGMGG